MNNTEKKYSEIMNSRMNRLFIGLFMGVVGFWVLSFMFLSDGIEQRNEYYGNKDIVIPVSATISDINETDENEYSIAVSYEYNNEVYEDVHWMRTNTKYKVGDIVEIRINPERPVYIFPEDNGTKDIVVGICLFIPSSAIITAVVIHLIKKRKR
ncbi:MAG: hypothetical protein E7536_06490 [Ruminococcaceae bacterium]|nr:hypothetical protein [Oscillospiraceae bacterium]